MIAVEQRPKWRLLGSFSDLGDNSGYDSRMYRADYAEAVLPLWRRQTYEFLYI